MSAKSRLSAQEYLGHHLHNWSVGTGGFWTVNLDTLLISWLIMGAIVYLLKTYHKNLSNVGKKKPSRLDVCLEWAIEWVRDLTRSVFGYDDVFGSAFNFAIVTFLGLANALAFIPPDFFSYILSWFGVSCFKAQISSDINFALGLALCSVGISVLRPVKVFGLTSLISLFATHPFPHWAFFPVNIPLNLVSTCAKIFSLMLRLFVNMFIGDFGFLLIAAYVSGSVQWMPWGIWSVYHLLIVPIQTYVFLLFGAIYLSSALDDAKGH